MIAHRCQQIVERGGGQQFGGVGWHRAAGQQRNAGYARRDDRVDRVCLTRQHFADPLAGRDAEEGVLDGTAHVAVEHQHRLVEGGERAGEGVEGERLAFPFLRAGDEDGARQAPGGGEQQQIVQQVKVQKVIKLKYIVNPFSAILFHVPPIDDIKLQLTELTHHAYKVGYGQGKGAGYAGGTKFGKVRFIRLEYSGGDWDQDFGIGADLNMLIEYNVRTQQKVHNKTESRTVMQLKNFPIGKSPPMVYLTGQRSISLSNNEVKVLRNYLTEKHGMIFGDNGGSGHFHRQFLSMMEKPDVDHIEGLSPAISIEQKSTSHNPRSTVGTITEIYDYLRLMFARVGTPRCPDHDVPLDAQTVSQIRVRGGYKFALC